MPGARAQPSGQSVDSWNRTPASTPVLTWSFHNSHVRSEPRRGASSVRFVPGQLHFDLYTTLLFHIEQRSDCLLIRRFGSGHLREVFSDHSHKRRLFVQFGLRLCGFSATRQDAAGCRRRRRGRRRPTNKKRTTEDNGSVRPLLPATPGQAVVAVPLSKDAVGTWHPHTKSALGFDSAPARSLLSVASLPIEPNLQHVKRGWRPTPRAAPRHVGDPCDRYRPAPDPRRRSHHREA